jgi:hypothetical protein
MPNNKQHSTSEFWYGYNLLREGKPLYLYDHRYSNANWKGAATISGGKVTRADVADFADLGALSLPLQNDLAKHAIIHADSPEQIYTVDDSELIVLWVSTTPARAGEHTRIPAPPDSLRIVQFVMKDGNAYRKTSDWLPKFLALDFETAKIISEAQDRDSLDVKIQQRFSHFLDITHPGDPTAELAFRLLCEARVTCGSVDEKDRNGLTIHAPKDLAAWLVPFSVHGDDNQKIAEVVAMMGCETAKKAAQAVFAALQKNENALELAKAFPGVCEFVSGPVTNKSGGSA